MLAVMVWGQLCKNKTARHSKQEEIKSPTDNAHRRTEDLPSPWTSPEARDGWCVAMDVDRNCLGGEQFFNDPHASSNWRQSSGEEQAL